MRRRRRSSARRRYDDEPRTYKSSYRGTNRRDGGRSVRFESDEEEDRDDSPVRTSRPMTPYPEPTTIQRDESIRLFQDLQRKKRKYRKIFLPSIPKEVIMGRRTYLEHEERTRRISRRVQNRLKLQEPVTFTLVRDKKGKLGVKMDRELNITKVEKFAAKCGASIGQKIIEFNDIPVVTKKDVLNAMKKTGGIKAKKCKLTIVFDPLAQTELRAKELSQLSHIKVKVPLHVVPKIEMDLYPSRPDLPSELEETRPVSPLKRDTPSKAHALHVRDMLFKDEKLNVCNLIRVHDSPLAFDVSEKPSSPTRISSPTRGQGKRHNSLRLVERSTMSMAQSHDFLHRNVERIGLEEDHVAHRSHDIDWPSREHRRVLRMEHAYRTNHAPRIRDVETRTPVLEDYDDEEDRTIHASPKRKKGMPSYRADRAEAHVVEREACVRHEYLEDARIYFFEEDDMLEESSDTLSRVYQEKFPPSTRSRRIRFESVELPSHVKLVRTNLDRLESARNHVVTVEELREHSLSPKRRHMPSSRGRRRFSSLPEYITRAGHVRHHGLDDGHDNLDLVEELREHSVSPKRRHVPSSRGKRYEISSRMDAVEVEMLKYDDLEDANIIRAALRRLKSSIQSVKMRFERGMGKISSGSADKRKLMQRWMERHSAEMRDILSSMERLKDSMERTRERTTMRTSLDIKRSKREIQRYKLVQDLREKNSVDMNAVRTALRHLRYSIESARERIIPPDDSTYRDMESEASEKLVQSLKILISRRDRAGIERVLGAVKLLRDVKRRQKLLKEARDLLISSPSSARSSSSRSMPTPSRPPGLTDSSPPSSIHPIRPSGLTRSNQSTPKKKKKKRNEDRSVREVLSGTRTESLKSDIKKKKEAVRLSSSSDTSKNIIIHVSSDYQTLQKLASEETDAERIAKEEGLLTTITEEMEHLWFHFAYYCHRFLPRDLDHLSVTAASSFVRDLCQVMRQQQRGRRGRKKKISTCKQMNGASTKILLHAICRRGKSVSIMFGDFIRLIYCFSTPCKNDLPCCSTCIMQSLREDVRVDQIVFRHVKRDDVSIFVPEEKSRLKRFRDFVKNFVLHKIPTHTKLELIFRVSHHKRPADLFFRGHYDDMLSKRIVDSLRRLFLSFTIVDHQNATTQTGGHHVDADSMRRKSTRMFSRTGGGVVSRIYWPQFYLICELLCLNTILQVRDLARIFLDSATPEIEHVDRAFFDHHFDQRTKLLYVRALTLKTFSEALFRVSICLNHSVTSNSHDDMTRSLNVDSVQDLWIPLFRFVALQKPMKNNAFGVTSHQRNSLDAFVNVVAIYIGSLTMSELDEEEEKY
eukprot:g1500.t1